MTMLDDSQPLVPPPPEGDLSGSKQVEQQLRQELQRRDEFLAILSHELRNPLGAVVNATRVIRRSLDSRENLEAGVSIIEQQVSQMSRLLDDLLDISRIANNKVTLQIEPLDLCETARRAVETVREQFERRGHKLELSLPSESVPVEGDSARLLQVIGNLLSNAARYTQLGGRVSLRLTRHGSEAQLSVCDNGRGISEEMLPMIFEPFTQGDDSDDVANGGMGVGLALVKSLVELQGGSIEARSHGKNQGSEFVVRLALTDHPCVKPPVVESLPAVVPRRIALVEDNPQSRQALKMLLQLEGFQVCDAAQAASGLEMIVREQPEVAILDIGLPDMSGYRLAEQLRAAMQGKAPYLIALTGYGRESDRQAVFQAGFHAHLVKPLDIEKLYEALRSIP